MAATEQRVKFAVIGCGHIGKRHVEMIARNPESQLIGLADVKEKSALKIDQYEVPFYSSIEDLLCQHQDVDVISIATPNGFHAEHALKALEAKKHVVVEKPMALRKGD